jgi:alkanesulfonate monooxygenase SsuD/methylene tetrahydromethanopterin reductase-like flavin-dependent oxidoreductase (luciferase family)
MRYGFIIPRGDLETIVELAVEAEAAGWDGVFYWDGIYIEGAGPMYDPWVALAAVAMRTRRVRIGAILTPPARRRPWKLARETATLDHLSHGRLVLPVGMGALEDGGFGQDARAAPRREPGDPHGPLERQAVQLPG